MDNAEQLYKEALAIDARLNLRTSEQVNTDEVAAFISRVADKLYAINGNECLMQSVNSERITPDIVDWYARESASDYEPPI